MSPDAISAAAAVIQAVGALGAIYFSLKIANDAGARERESEAKSVARAEDAERKANERIAAADAARYNRDIELIVSRLPPLLEDLERTLAEERPKIATHPGEIWAGYDSKPRQELERMLTRVGFNIEDPILGFAVDDMILAAQKWEVGHGVSWGTYVEGLESYRDALLRAAAAVEALRR